MSTIAGIRGMASPNVPLVAETHDAPDANLKRAQEQKQSVKEASEPHKELSAKDIEKMASEVQIHLKRLNTELRLEVDNQSDKVLVKILDQETKKVIRQIPSEELVAIRARMEELIGVLYKDKT